MLARWVLDQLKKQRGEKGSGGPTGAARFREEGEKFDRAERETQEIKTPRKGEAHDGKDRTLNELHRDWQAGRVRATVDRPPRKRRRLPVVDLTLVGLEGAPAGLV